jgi:hypothetical protein
MPLPFMVWGLPCVFLRGVPCLPLFLIHYFCGASSPGSRRGYIWVAPTPLGMTGNLAPSFCLWGVFWLSVVFVPWLLQHSFFWAYLGGGPWIHKRIYWSGTCHMRFGQRPLILLLSMGGTLFLNCSHPLAAPLFGCLGILMGGLLSPPLLLVGIVGGLHSPPLLLGLQGP